MMRMLLLFTVVVSCKQTETIEIDRRGARESLRTAVTESEKASESDGSLEQVENDQPLEKEDGDEESDFRESRKNKPNENPGTNESGSKNNDADDEQTIPTFDGEVSRSEFVAIARNNCGDCHELKARYSDDEIKDMLRRVSLKKENSDKMPQGRDWQKPEDQAKFIRYIETM